MLTKHQTLAKNLTENEEDYEEILKILNKLTEHEIKILTSCLHSASINFGVEAFDCNEEILWLDIDDLDLMLDSDMEDM